MLRRFEVKNFKNFKDPLVIDFTNVHDYKYSEHCIKNDLICKMIIYGKNAEGKSNLGYALFDLFYDVIFGRSMLSTRNSQRLYKNANAEEDDLVEFYYSFKFDDDSVDYEYKKKNEYNTVFERLKVNDKTIFYYDLESAEKDFSNVDVINANELNWEEFFETGEVDTESMWPTALRYIAYNTVQKDSSVMYKLIQFIKGMRLTNSITGYMSINVSFDEYFKETEELEKFEKFLNNYGIKCKLVMREHVDGKKELYFDYAKPLHFASNLSSGTVALTRFYLQYIIRNKPAFVFIDEFDAFYHHELSTKMVELLEKEFDCQVILTSHNTDLLSNSIMRPDCFMILSNGKLTPICEATNREIRQGHNLEKLYKNGEFNV